MTIAKALQKPAIFNHQVVVGRGKTKPPFGKMMGKVPSGAAHLCGQHSILPVKGFYE
ncbi:hypothetical protein KCP73_18515 [Salmonella enterica subsp. enterica]|nr:hypothetical protein KCP73_18515 [Salmonella enterica subsp. enterica]